MNYKELRTRRGRFELSDSAIEQTGWEELSEFFGQFVIVRAEYMYNNRTFQYDAMSPLFEALEDGSMIPTYQVMREVRDGKCFLRIAMPPPPKALVETAEWDGKVQAAAYSRLGDPIKSVQA